MILQTIHKYRRTLVGVTFLLLLAISLSGLGLGAIRSLRDHERGNFAIKVNDREISFSEFSKLAKQSRQGPQATVDRLIGSALLEQTALKAGFRAGKSSVERTIRDDIFRGSFSPQLYLGFLQQMGISAQEFEATIQKEALRSEYAQLLSDVSFASDSEARLRLELEETKYDVDYLEIDPQSFIEKAPTPSEEEISTFYNEHSADFEVAAAVAYDYITFSPEEYEKSVEVSPDDIELYYADHESDFATPEAVKARHIRLLYPKNSKPEQMADLKEKANQVLSRVNAGESFDALALEFSDDAATKNVGGDLGWVSKGKMSKEFDAAALKLKGAGVAELVDADYGFQIVKVDEYKPAGTKSLEEVREQITKEIQKRDAPLYAANRAQELFEAWKKSGIKLSEFASQRGLKAASTNGLLTSEMDPETAVKGLTAEVLPLASEEKQLADAGDKSALVQVTRSRESDIAPLTDVKDKIISRIKAIAARDLARKEAERIRTEMKGSYPTLAAAATATKLKKESAAGLQRNKKKDGVLGDSDIQRGIFSAYSPNEQPSQVFEKAGKFYLVQVTAISKPAPDVVEKKLALFKEIESSRVGGTFIESIINQLKKSADIQVNPQVLAQE